MVAKANEQKSQAIEVPSFFQLPAYEVCDDWQPKDWAAALKDRLKARKYWQLACLNGSKVVPEWMVADARDLAENLIRHPGQRLRQTTIDKNHSALRVQVATDAAPALKKEIRDQTVFEYFDGGAEWGRQQDSPYWKWILCCDALAKAGADDVDALHAPETIGAIEGVSDVLKICDMPAREMHSEVGEQSSTVFVAVDFGATDKELIRQFSGWLKDTRNALSKKRNPALPDQEKMKGWATKKYLPYLDLSFWAMTNSGVISNRKMADALYPGWYKSFRTFGGKDRTDMVERTISVVAESLLEEDFVMSLSR